MDFRGKIQVLINLDVVNRVSYGYYCDKFGSKRPQAFGKRSTLPDLIKKLVNTHNINEDTGINNEIAVKHRIAPHYIRGFIINDRYRDDFIQALRNEGLIQMNSEGKECINGKTLDKFIYSEWQFKQEMWDE